jgi:hypothetical protein
MRAGVLGEVEVEVFLFKAGSKDGFSILCLGFDGSSPS